MLEINAVSFSYGEALALHDISLKVEKGTVTTLLGSNGAGKTTLMHVISGLRKPASGTIVFNGTNITGLSTYQIYALGLLHVPEGRKLFSRMTVSENLELGALKEKHQQRKALMAHVFELFPILEKRQHQTAGTLSGGEQQQLAIGRCLMGKPKMILLDEPTLGLSPVLADSVLKTVHRLNNVEGITILLVSQEVISALEIADFGYVLENGEINIKGSQNELLQNSNIRSAYLGL